MIDCSCVATGYDTVPPYAGGVYYRTKYSIISKAYHPFRRKRISLKSTTFVCRQMWCFSWKEREKKIPAPNADTPPAFEQSEAGRRRKRKRTPFSGVLAARTETAETERQVVLLMWCARQDLNLHGLPLEPKSSVSANSTTGAYSLSGPRLSRILPYPIINEDVCQTPRRPF